MDNIMDWLKFLYQLFGSKYPTTSLIVVSVFGAILSGGSWWLIGLKYENDSARHSAPPPRIGVHTGPATTTGNNSPANTGSGNVTTYQRPEKSSNTR